LFLSLFYGLQLLVYTSNRFLLCELQ
jgi:hypothetical protein